MLGRDVDLALCFYMYMYVTIDPVSLTHKQEANPRKGGKLGDTTDSVYNICLIFIEV